MNVQGYVAFLLHAHIPYVRHEEENITLEERWFFEAVVDSYLPLIEMMDRLLEDEVPFHLTLSLSPTLLAMLEDSRLKKRLRRHLTSLCELAAARGYPPVGSCRLRPYGEALCRSISSANGYVRSSSGRSDR